MYNTINQFKPTNRIAMALIIVSGFKCLNIWIDFRPYNCNFHVYNEVLKCFPKRIYAAISVYKKKYFSYLDTKFESFKWKFRQFPSI